MLHIEKLGAWESTTRNLAVAAVVNRGIFNGLVLELIVVLQVRNAQVLELQMLAWGI